MVYGLLPGTVRAAHKLQRKVSVRVSVGKRRGSEGEVGGGPVRWAGGPLAWGREVEMSGG
jgi:hypothetical protein